MPPKNTIDENHLTNDFPDVFRFGQSEFDSKNGLNGLRILEGNPSGFVSKRFDIKRGKRSSFSNIHQCRRSELPEATRAHAFESAVIAQNDVTIQV